MKPLAKTNYRIANELALLYRIWGTKGYELENESKVKKSIEIYKSAIKLKIDNIQSYDGICKSFYLFNDNNSINESIRYAQDGLKRKPKDRGLNLFLAEVYTYKYLVKDRNKALEYINKLPNLGWYGNKKKNLLNRWK